MRISRGTANPGIVRLAVENAADTFHWLLDSGFEPLDEHPIIHYGHEPYTTPRTYWGKDEGRSVMNVLVPQFDAEVAAGGIELWLNSKLIRLVKDHAGAVTGAVISHKGDDVTVEANAVILASARLFGQLKGPTMFPELSAGKPLYGGGLPPIRRATALRSRSRQAGRSSIRTSSCRHSPGLRTRIRQAA